MYFIRSPTFIMALFFTVTLIQGKPIYSSTSSKIKDQAKHLLNQHTVENEYTRFLSYLKIYPPKDNMRLRTLYDELFSFNTYISDLADVYAKYYTMDEIMELIKFYSSPLGEKVIRFNNIMNQQMEDLMLTKISDYIFTSAEYGFTIALPEFH